MHLLALQQELNRELGDLSGTLTQRRSASYVQYAQMNCEVPEERVLERVLLERLELGAVGTGAVGSAPSEWLHLPIFSGGALFSFSVLLVADYHPARFLFCSSLSPGAAGERAEAAGHVGLPKAGGGLLQAEPPGAGGGLGPGGSQGVLGPEAGGRGGPSGHDLEFMPFPVARAMRKPVKGWFVNGSCFLKHVFFFGF